MNMFGEKIIVPISKLIIRNVVEMSLFNFFIYLYFNCVSGAVVHVTPKFW
jgi:hypothetical protein